jgi:predicted transcriptional regulator
MNAHASNSTDRPAARYLSVSEIASILGVSDDTISRQFENREGVIDVGTPESMHKRRKRMLRISQAAFERYIAERQVKVRRR